MKKITLITFAALVLFSCKKQIAALQQELETIENSK
jgi:PBP1b-binding outer membrane lipoprotein LpoB